MKTTLSVIALVLLASSPLFSQSQSASGAPATSQKSIAEVARENRDGKVRRAAEQTVNLVCSNIDDPKVKAAYPGIQEACKDKPRLIQAVFESSLKKQTSLPTPDKVDGHLSDTPWHYTNGVRVPEEVSQALASQDAPPDSVAAAQARVDKVCTHDLSMTPAQITSSMVDCDKAYRDLQNAMSAAPPRSSSGTGYASARPGDYVVSLTGTPGLPVTGDCFFAGKSETYDDVLPAEHVLAAGRGINCSFMKKSVQGTLKMQVLQNGTVRNESETEASYGLVSSTVDY